MGSSLRVEPFSAADLTENAFLGGQVRLLQPKSGYRAGIDPVLLAASVNAAPGDQVLDLGCGGGVAMICLAARVSGIAVTGVELQPAYADLARQNLALNGLHGSVYCADVVALPDDLKRLQFDHVIANPPYFDPAARSPKAQADAELARAGETALGEWVTTAARRLKPSGSATFILAAERTPEVLAHMQTCLGSLEFWPIAPRVGRAARLGLVRGKKNGRAAFKCHAPLILHQGTQHERDGESYTKPVSDVLRRGTMLSFPAH